MLLHKTQNCPHCGESVSPAIVGSPRAQRHGIYTAYVVEVTCPQDKCDGKWLTQMNLRGSND